MRIKLTLAQMCTVRELVNRLKIARPSIYELEVSVPEAQALFEAVTRLPANNTRQYITRNSILSKLVKAMNVDYRSRGFLIDRGGKV